MKTVAIEVGIGTLALDRIRWQAILEEDLYNPDEIKSIGLAIARGITPAGANAVV